jgi:hypothetical protein
MKPTAEAKKATNPAIAMSHTMALIIGWCDMTRKPNENKVSWMLRMQSVLRRARIKPGAGHGKPFQTKLVYRALTGKQKINGPMGGRRSLFFCATFRL